MTRVLSLWNSQQIFNIMKILSHLPHEGTVRCSSPFDDTNSYFDLTHIFALKNIFCDINTENSDFSHFNWTHRFYLTIWNGLLEFKANYDTRNACHHNYINVMWDARLPFAGNREGKKYITSRIKKLKYKYMPTHTCKRVCTHISV